MADILTKMEENEKPSKMAKKENSTMRMVANKTWKTNSTFTGNKKVQSVFEYTMREFSDFKLIRKLLCLQIYPLSSLVNW